MVDMTEHMRGYVHLDSAISTVAVQHISYRLLGSSVSELVHKKYFDNVTFSSFRFYQRDRSLKDPA